MGKLRKDEQGFSAVEVILVLVIVVLVGAVGFLVYKNHNNTTTASVAPTTTKTAATVSTKTGTPTQPIVQYGTISGTPSYPSEGIPADEKACVVSVADSSKIYCDNIGEKQTKPTCSPVADANCDAPALVKFSIKVPTGDYFVYATAEKELPNYRAYYDEYSKCGNSVNCPITDHKQYIKVTVTPNATVENADPGDWYAN